MRTLAILLLALVITALSLSTTATHAWWQSGHSLCAIIAERRLSSRVKEIVNWYFNWLSVTGPFPKNPDMVNGAPFPDEVKGYGLLAMNSWHFINLEYDPSNYSYPIKGCPLQKANAVHMLSGYTSLMKAIEGGLRDKKPWVVSIALAYIVHIYGDIHQPLHCTELFSKDMPEGDLGGNRFSIWWQGKFTKETGLNLHGFWDSLCGQYTGNEAKQPYSASHLEFLNKLATEYTERHPCPADQAKVYDPTVMANESFNYAVKAAYHFPNGSLIKNGDVIDTGYQNKCIPIMEERLSYCGARLATQLEFLFKYAKLPTTTPAPGPGPDTSTTATAPATDAPGTNAPGSHNHHTPSPNAPPPAPPTGDDKWTSKTTEVFIGGIALGAAIVCIIMLVNKYVIGGGGAAAAGASEGGYQDINNA